MDDRGGPKPLTADTGSCKTADPVLEQRAQARYPASTIYQIQNVMEKVKFCRKVMRDVYRHLSKLFSPPLLRREIRDPDHRNAITCSKTVFASFVLLLLDVVDLHNHQRRDYTNCSSGERCNYWIHFTENKLDVGRTH